ncbi:MAG TPA: hypothetical protein VMU54_16400, partial [Planctomycetota bacterium]|nr:hypothetical protein [Planctomycetota bacterium]
MESHRSGSISNSGGAGLRRRGRTGIPLRLRSRGSSAGRIALGVFLLTSPAWAQDVLTWHNDNARTGQNQNETILTPSNVNSANFGKLFSHSVDGSINAQPLMKRGVPINGSTHNVVFVVTSNNSAYAFDADSNSGANANPLWKVNFGGANRGTIGTPVIDSGTNTLYCVSNESGSVNRLHALDITTGAEKFGGPSTISASVNGNGDGSSNGKINFSTCSPNQLERLGLLLTGGVVYFGYGSPGDVFPYHGWLMGYSASNVQNQVVVFNDTPQGGAGGIWMSGAGPSEDSSGNIYVTSGNGTLSAQNGG